MSTKSLVKQLVNIGLSNGLIFGAVTLLALGFAVLLSSTLAIQQRHVALTHETNSEIVPRLMLNIRVIRNIEMMRHYGGVAANATDPQTRQDAAFLAAYAAANPGPDADRPSQDLMKHAYRTMRSILVGEMDPAAWRAINRQLTAHADATADSAGQEIKQRSEALHHDAITSRNLALAQAALFAISLVLLMGWSWYWFRKLQTKTRYYNEVSHDLRTLVMGLKMTAHEGSAGPRQSMPMALSRLTSMSVDLHHYLDEFLLEARSEAASVQVHLERVALGDTFLQLISQFEDITAAQQVDLRCRMTPLHAMADRELLKRMLGNLVSNALRYARSRVLVTARRRGEWVELAVWDNGEGMTPPNRQAASRSGTQGKPPLPPPPQARPPAAAQALHFGLGLAMVRRSVKALGGTMHIKTVPGRGTVVVLRLVPGVEALKSPQCGCVA